MPNQLKYGNIVNEDGQLKPSSNFEEFYQWAGLGPGKKVLDLGCGYGRNYIAFNEKGCKAYGLDLSEEALSHAKKSLGGNGTSIRLVKGDIGSLPFRDGSFDTVYANAIPAKDVIDKFNGLSRLLRNGGKAYIKLIQGVEHQDTVEHPEYKALDFMHSLEEIKGWFDRDSGIIFEELFPAMEQGENGFQLTYKAVVRIEK